MWVVAFMTKARIRMAIFTKARTMSCEARVPIVDFMCSVACNFVDCSFNGLLVLNKDRGPVDTEDKGVFVVRFGNQV